MRDLDNTTWQLHKICANNKAGKSRLKGWLGEDKK